MDATQGETPQPERQTDVQGHVYLLHFTAPVGHARHYLGWAAQDGLFRRLAQHESGNGSAASLLKELKKRGGRFVLAQTFVGSKHDERRLKNRGSLVRLCPICRGEIVQDKPAPRKQEKEVAA